MNWEEKLIAVKALGTDVTLHIREPGNWYAVASDVKVKSGIVLESRYGNGTTPEGAAEQLWTELTVISDHEYLIVNGPRGRRAYRWAGVLWVEVDETAEKEARR